MQAKLHWLIYSQFFTKIRVIWYLESHTLLSTWGVYYQYIPSSPDDFHWPRESGWNLPVMRNGNWAKMSTQRVVRISLQSLLLHLVLIRHLDVANVPGDYNQISRWDKCYVTLVLCRTVILLLLMMLFSDSFPLVTDMATLHFVC